MLKIAHVINTLAGGGSERVAIQLYRCLRDKYHSEFIIAKDIVDYDVDFQPKILFKFKKKPFYLPTAIYERVLLEKLYESLKDFDVVISHLRDMNTRLCLIKKKRDVKFKLIMVEHVTKDFYSDKEIRLIKELYKYADLAIGVSEKAVENLKEYGVRNPVLVENFVDLDTVEKLSNLENIVIQGFSFLGMGRLSYDKGFDTLIKAFRIANIPNSYLYIIGSGKKEKELKHLAKKLGIEDRVKFLGFIKNPFPYIKACSVYVTSSNREAFPLATLEAMALGKPIITTDVVPFANHKLNAFVVPPKDEFKMAQGMKILYEDANLRETISKNALLTAKNYTVEKFCKKYTEIVNSIL